MEIIDKDQNPAFAEKLRELIESTKDWGSKISGFDLEDAEHRFMEQITDLYLEYFQFHEEEVKIFIIDYRPSLSSIYSFISEEYIEDVIYALLSLDPEENAWLFACQVRTKIEAFNALFSSITGKLNSQPFDEFLEERKNYPDRDPYAMPKNPPKTHWWWYV